MSLAATLAPASGELQVDDAADDEPAASNEYRSEQNSMAAIDDPKTLGRSRLSFATEGDVDEFVRTLD